MVFYAGKERVFAGKGRGSFLSLENVSVGKGSFPSAISLGQGCEWGTLALLHAG
jgi:hypothetical protein